ncbi:MAG TPA: HAMP domain-containing sensor histidine kinase [Thiobacillaceae bacterium]|nr:HAMP domain-containing sensor histidine kinase [Thiobacillaceae bacterium]
MRFNRSLRFRVGAAFAAIGGVISLVAAIGLYVAVRDAGERLIDETLKAEIQDYLSRRNRNPLSPPPSTATLLGYVLPARTGEPVPPAAIADWKPGLHEIRLGETFYRVAIAERAGSRYFLLYNETLFREKQAYLILYLAGFVALMTLLSGGLALWLAERVIEPVKELARRVREVRPDSHPGAITADFPHDEVGELARAFEQALDRLADFIDRERAFTADVSHELRTPIAVIRGAAEVLLADASRPEKDRQRLERIERGAADMADLSTALLAMARERDDDRREPADLAALVEASIDKHQHLLGARPVALSVELSARPRLAADANLLAIVIANLLRNSFTYTERGSIRVRVDARTLTVTDTGLGIPRAALDKVFQRHYRGTHSEGAGIGLALVKKICERYGWSIALESEEGQGTRAVLTFERP